jgi:hypothetical protein
MSFELEEKERRGEERRGSSQLSLEQGLKLPIK